MGEGPLFVCRRFDSGNAPSSLAFTLFAVRLSRYISITTATSLVEKIWSNQQPRDAPETPSS